jgi:hypothetical protein
MHISNNLTYFLVDNSDGSGSSYIVIAQFPKCCDAVGLLDETL